MVIGSFIVVNGIFVNADDIIAKSVTVVEGANLHQIALALEIYYLDYGRYPDVSGGEELINLLKQREIIRNLPLDSSVYTYYSKNNGESFYLDLKSH